VLAAREIPAKMAVVHIARINGPYFNLPVRKKQATILM
jgi:hypothetical protein